MVEVAVVLHEIPVHMAVDIRRPRNQVAGDDRNLHSQGAEIVFHVLVEFPVHIHAELHEIRIPGGPAVPVPGPGRVIGGLVEAALHHLHSALGRILVLPKRTDAVLCPGLLQALSGVVFHQQVMVEAPPHLIPVWLHLVPIVRAHGPLDGGILVVNLHCDHGRVIPQRQAGVRIHMAEELLRVLLLQLNQAGIVHGMPLDA